MKQRRVWKGIFWAVVVLVVAGVALRLAPSGEVMVMPGITGNLKKMVAVKDGRPAGRGRLLMVAVDIGTVSELQYLVNQLNPTVEFVPVSNALGGLTMKQYIQYNDDLMEESQLSAEVAGEKLAGLPARVENIAGALIAGVVKHSPAVGKLKAGELITAVGPYRVTSPTQLESIMKKFKVGEIINITVKDKGQTSVVPIKTTHLKGDANPAIGIYIEQLQRAIVPRPVTIHAGSIGGPSAGMMFGLEIYDQITGSDLAKGHIIAGTGEILPNGHVEEIGGVAQKVVTVYRAGARVFLVPKGNYPKAEHMAKKMGYHITIYPVTTISQALHDIEKATS